MKPHFFVVEYADGTRGQSPCFQSTQARDWFLSHGLWERLLYRVNVIRKF